MRRPSPLPPPGGESRTPARSGAGTGAAAGEPADTGAEQDEAAGAAELAPVISMTAPIALPGTAPGGTSEAPADEGVGWRDVWRAARARRRALRGEVRRFTVRQRRRRMLWIGAAASVVLVAAGTTGAAYSPLFAVETITVVGTDELDAADVEDALSSQVGTPLPLVDESAVKAALVTFPLVESYVLEARPPHELVVRIVERTPIGLIRSAAGYTLVDAAGVALSTTERPVSGVPVITVTGGTASAAFEAIGQVMRSLPDGIRDRVTAVAASTPDDVTLTFGRTDTEVVWGSAEDSAMKALVLATAMQARPPRSVSVYDVSSPDAIVIR